MPTGALTSYLDVAQVVLYAFWVFFFGLIIYLRREDKREGYPLEADLLDNDGQPVLKSFSLPPLPAPKTFLLHDGQTVTAPRPQRDTRPIKAVPVARWPGAPLQPTGNPMLDCVGAGSWAERADVPDLTFEGLPKIVPLRADAGFYLEARDPDPRGMQVFGADNVVAGTVVEAWADRSETLVRYLEVEVTLAPTPRRVLLPMTLVRIQPARYAGPDGPITERVIEGRRKEVRVQSIMAHQFADVPAHKHPDQVTLREEDQICAYYAAGHRYAGPWRLGPVL